eukprot:gene9815-biopygen3748
MFVRSARGGGCLLRATRSRERPHSPGRDLSHGSAWESAGEPPRFCVRFVRFRSRPFCVGQGRPLLRVRRRFRSRCRSPRAGWRGLAMYLRCAGPGPSYALVPAVAG